MFFALYSATTLQGSDDPGGRRTVGEVAGRARQPSPELWTCGARAPLASGRATEEWTVTVERTAIDGLLVVRWDTHGDERGFFRQTYQRSEL